MYTVEHLMVYSHCILLEQTYKNLNEVRQQYINSIDAPSAAGRLSSGNCVYNCNNNKIIHRMTVKSNAVWRNEISNLKLHHK